MNVFSTTLCIGKMHKLPNKSSVIRFRISAALVCLKSMLILAIVAVYGWAFATHDRQLAVIGLWLAASVVVVLPLRLMISSSCQCPLCRSTVLSRIGCSKNTKAKNFFGSYRLRVALQILLRNRFRCPYCNETTEVTSRR